MATLDGIFTFHEYPKIIISDNALIFSSIQFKNYCHERGILQIFPAPGRPSTNGLVKRDIETIRDKINKWIKKILQFAKSLKKYFCVFKQLH